jgi:hypothetical protein
MVTHGLRRFGSPEVNPRFAGIVGFQRPAPCDILLFSNEIQRVAQPWVAAVAQRDQCLAFCSRSVT